jgi:NADH:ubiquinone oxidoreductase subunit F (NADH-binding)/Pyruvate/2-oxoacid:ferredoxin oxidoreductase delta subunit/(2Fe-2S) ferredoxin
MHDLTSRRKVANDDWLDLVNNSQPVIYFGMASCGRAAGAMEVRKAVEEAIDENFLSARLVDVGCIGPCYLEPLMDIAMPGWARVSYSQMTPARAKKMVIAALKSGIPPLEDAVGVLEPLENRQTGGLPRFFDHPMLKQQVRIILRNCGLIDPEELNHYLAKDGYQGLQNALQLSPEEVIEQVRISGLRGRGGSGFPTYKKWELCRAAPEKEKYLVCNADEGDPGAFMNRSLIEGDPHSLLEGLLIAAYAIGASHGIIYIRAEYPLAVARLHNALQQLRDNGLLGSQILGSDFNFEIKIKEGAGAFVCGEETALFASIEGKRGMPRSRPPYPVVSGLFGKPTVNNNVETLSALSNIFREGAEWYRQYGTPASGGTKTFSLLGKVRRTGLIEVPLGMTLRQIIFDIGGGTEKPFKAVQTGGPSGGCLSEEHLDTPVDYEALREAGSIMGSGGLIVMDKDTCIVDLAHYFLEFTQKESCGKCAPCRIGSRHLVEILDRITTGSGEAEDLNTIVRLSKTINQGSLCGLGQTVPNPVMTSLRSFRDEYEAHVHDGYCPAGVCKELYQYVILPEACTGCQACSRVCPVDAIQGELHQSHILDSTICIRCRACYEACRFDAIEGRPLN